MKIGILGGTFNPVHSGHVRMAIEVRERLGLDRVELVPAAIPPHKSNTGILPFDLRMGLVELAVYDQPHLVGNPVESMRKGPSYTLDTMQEFRSERPDDQPFFIMGTGTFQELPAWNNGLELPETTNLVAVNRYDNQWDRVDRFVEQYWPEAESEEPDLAEAVWKFPSGNKLYCIDVPRLDIKGGDIRKRWLSGRNLSLLMPEKVRVAVERGGPDYVSSWGAPAKRGG